MLLPDRNTIKPRRKISPRKQAAFFTLLVHLAILLVLLSSKMSENYNSFFNYLDVTELRQLEEFENSVAPITPQPENEVVKQETEEIPEKDIVPLEDTKESTPDTTRVAEAVKDQPDVQKRGEADTLNYNDFYASGTMKSNVKLPTFQGGDFNNFRNWFQKRFRVPFDAPENYREKVTISFVVDPTGKIQNVTVHSCSSQVVETEILRVMNNAPMWEPGILNGNYSGFNFRMPVSF